MYTKIKFELGSNLESAVNRLIEFKNKGMLVCGEFNTHILYSDTVTMDGAYQKVLGKTKAEFNKSQDEWINNRERQELEHKQNIPNLAKMYMGKGRLVLDVDKWESWDKVVPIRLNDLYKGIELQNCLDIVKILNNSGTLNEAKLELDSQDHSGMSYSLVLHMVKEFCKRGSEFFEYVKS